MNTSTDTMQLYRNDDGDEQIIEPVGYDFGLTRRTFVQVLGAGLLIAVAAPSIADGQERRRGGGGGGGGEFAGSKSVPLDARIHIGKDGAITVLTGKVEGGQGARAEITQAAAEELRVPVDHVTLLMADTELCPDDGFTAGSRTTPSTLPSIRNGCAAARQLLEKWRGGDLSKTFADLAAADAKSLSQVPGTDVQVTPTSDWKVLGKATARPNGREILTGTHKYPSDIVRPGMLYGKLLRRPSYGAKLTDVSTDAAKAMEGVIVVRDGDFVGIAAPNTSIAKAAIKTLEESAKWDQPPHPSSKELFEYLKKNTKGGVPSNPFADEVSGAAKSLRAEYHVPYVQHTPMEPRAAVAEWDENGKVTVWTATQNPFGVRREIASAFHIDEDKVRVIVPDFGGGFGGKHTGETAVEAARLAQAAKKPVAVRWTRAEEFTWAYFRPAAVIECEASLDASGKLTSWHFVNINAGRPGIESPYRCEKKNQQAVDSAPALRHGSYRALAATANNFARESFIDELAAAAGKDPLQFRLDHIESDRLRAVVEEAVKQFGWSDRRAKQRDANVGVGLACATEKGSFVATCAEVEIDPAKNVAKVKRIVQAFECGAITNPSNLQSQNIGAIIQGLGPTLREAMLFEEGKIQNASLWKYEVPRQADVPVIEVHLVNRPDLASAGAGETPLIALAPAINNAIFDATQKRLRQMPLKLA